MRPIVLPAALLAAALLAPPAFADRETAVFHAGRGEKALQDKDWAGAESHFRRAMQEDEKYLPARHGLAQALLGAGKTTLGLATLRGFVDAVRAEPPADADGKALAAKAEKQLKDLDASFGELEKLTDRFAADLVALARKWSAKDPSLAARAVRRALDVRPGHAEATALLEKFGVSKASRVVLFDGKDVNSWSNFRPPEWQLRDGAIVGRATEGAYLVRSLKEFKGDFDVRAEMRVIEELQPEPAVGLAAALSAPEDHYYLGLLNRKIQVLDRKGADTRRVQVVLPSDFKGTIDLAGWNVYELRFRGGEVASFVNGVEVAREPRPSSRGGGFVGLFVGGAEAAFRGIEVQPR